MRRFVLWFVTVIALGIGDARADEIELLRAAVEPTEESYVLDADFAFELNPRLEDALASGVPLWFVVEFQAERWRWYWLNERIADRRLPLRLSFHTLTRQYRVSSGALYQNYPTLPEAVRALSRIRDWPVLDRGQLKPDETYEASLRMRLDVAQLPKPFQVTALTNRDWTLASEWKRWKLRAVGGER